MEPEEQLKNKVHWVLAHSYSFYFLMFLVGIFFDSVFPLKIFESSFTVPTGVVLIILATTVIYWAQKTSRSLNKENLTKDTFSRGPYSITRSPTHWGLFFMMLGFGLIINAVFLVISSLLSLLITRLVFLKKEENILGAKYGSPYEEYKQSVKL